MEKVYYTIREVSELLDVSLSCLRYWESQFEELTPHTNGRQTRFYTKEDIELISLIKYLRNEQKLSIPAIKMKLKVDRKGVERRVKIADNLKRIRAQLIIIRNLI